MFKELEPKKQPIEEGPEGGHEEKFSQTDAEELRELRKMQIDAKSDEDFGKENIQRFRELNNKETRLKRDSWTKEEESEWLVLTSEQTKSKDWTPEKAKRLLYFNEKREKSEL